MTPEGQVRAGTSWEQVPLVEEITLLTAARPSGLWDLWEQTGRDGPPFWAFPWAGGQALARYVLDHPDLVRGRRVLDVASGSGLVAIAAATAGAASVVATDIDPNAVAAIAVNAAANGVPVTARVADLAAGYPDPDPDADSVAGSAGYPDAAGAGADPEVVLAGDVFYQRDLAELALVFLRAAARSGADVFAADPGRAFFPAGPGLPALAVYQVPVLTAIETVAVKTVTVYRLS